jgi:hypothetical protein
VRLDKPAPAHLSQLYNNSDLFPDVVVSCGQELVVKAHKAVLGAHSHTFLTAFTQKGGWS